MKNFTKSCHGLPLPAVPAGAISATYTPRSQTMTGIPYLTLCPPPANESRRVAGRTWTHTAIETIAGAHAVEFSKTAEPREKGGSSGEVAGPASADALRANQEL